MQVGDLPIPRILTTLGEVDFQPVILRQCLTCWTLGKVFAYVNQDGIIRRRYAGRLEEFPALGILGCLAIPPTLTLAHFGHLYHLIEIHAIDTGHIPRSVTSSFRRDNAVCFKRLKVPA
jgi:hypothetical protein